jgi:hypothetical protein
VNRGIDIPKELAALPHPRKHFWWAYAARGANEDMWHAPQGVHDPLRALYYYKSADCPGNKPFALKFWAAVELAKMPTYYIMNPASGDRVSPRVPSRECRTVRAHACWVFISWTGRVTRFPRSNRSKSTDC